MANESAGVYSQIIQLGNYVSAVPSTVGFIVALTEKGEDNKLRFISSQESLIGEFGKPNINKYGRSYSQGLYNAFNFLSESGSLYFMRVLPDDAAYANMRISIADGLVSVEQLADMNSLEDLKTKLRDFTTYGGGDGYPICILYAIGRGQYYNNLSVKFTPVSNPVANDEYIMDIYALQDDGSNVIIESFTVSFDPNATGTDGESIYLPYVLEKYSAILRALTEDDNDNIASGYNEAFRIYDRDVGTLSLDDANAILTDSGQDFEDWKSGYYIIMYDRRGRKAAGWTVTPTTLTDQTQIQLYTDKTGSTQGYALKDTSFDPNNVVSYIIKKMDIDISTQFANPVPLRYGSDGSLINTDGTLNTSVADQILANAYTGNLKNPKAIGFTVGAESAYERSVIDTENYYFNVVFDAGYPNTVKTSIAQLAYELRKDCIAILDMGDNASSSDAINVRDNTLPFNSYFVALYDNYSKVYDQFTGQDIWVAPSYHMSYLIPRNDTVASLYAAPAGFNRTAIQNIKETRYIPRQGDRDQLYLNQVNVIAKFKEGYAPWSQLTTQVKAGPMQDINIARLVLYIERALKEFARGFIFEENDEVTWSAVSAEVINFLEDIKRNRGLYSYRVEVGATDYERKNKTFHINVSLEPTRTTERIQLRFYVE